MPPITAHFRWTVEDLITGRKYAMKLKRGRLILIIGVAVAVFSFSLLSGNHPKHTSHGNHLSANLVIFGILLGAILIAVPLGKFTGAMIIRRQFAKRPDANQEIACEFSESGIATSSSNAKSEIKWPAFYKVLATPAGFLFMPNAQIFHFIPKRAFASPADIETLKTLARQHATEFKELK